MGSISVNVTSPCTISQHAFTTNRKYTLSDPLGAHCFCSVAQIKDAVRDGLRAVKNVIDDKAVVLGAGAFEVAAAQHLRETVKKQVGSKDCHIPCMS
jgi:hypothetical protein